jgi:hypothetical protein
MITDFAQRLADCPDITTEQLEAVSLYLCAKLNRERAEDRAISFLTVKSKRLVEKSLLLRIEKMRSLDKDAV